MPDDPVPWPTDLVPTDVTFDLDRVSTGGGRSLVGDEQVVMSDAGFWRASLSGIAIQTSAQVLAWRVMRGLLDGRSGTLLVPVFDSPRAPWPIDDYGRKLVPARIMDASLDGTLYADDKPALRASLIVATLAEVVTLGATQVIIDIARGSRLHAGMYFSVFNRLYVIRSIPSDALNPGDLALTDKVAAGTRFICEIRPRWRAASSPAGTALNFYNPVCPMRLADDAQGRLAVQAARFAAPTLELIEVT